MGVLVGTGSLLSSYGAFLSEWVCLCGWHSAGWFHREDIYKARCLGWVRRDNSDATTHLGFQVRHVHAQAQPGASVERHVREGLGGREEPGLARTHTRV
jgi:hypothetical protein